MSKTCFDLSLLTIRMRGNTNPSKQGKAVQHVFDINPWTIVLNAVSSTVLKIVWNIYSLAGSRWEFWKMLKILGMTVRIMFCQGEIQCLFWLSQIWNKPHDLRLFQSIIIGLLAPAIDNCIILVRLCNCEAEQMTYWPHFPSTRDCVLHNTVQCNTHTHTINACLICLLFSIVMPASESSLLWFDIYIFIVEKFSLNSWVIRKGSMPLGQSWSWSMSRS